MYRFYQWLAFFYIYSFFGWIWETSYVSVCKKHFVNRGFLHGPVIPIYGSGAIVMLFLALPVKDNLVLSYFVGLIGATLLELFTGWAMEALFKVKYWDYSDSRFQFHGYICLSSSLFWGFLTVALVRWVHAPVERLVLSASQKPLMAAVVFFTAFFVTDFSASAKEALDMRKVLVALERLRIDIERAQDELSLKVELGREELSGRIEEGRQQLAELKEQNMRQIEQKISRLKEQWAENLEEFSVFDHRIRRRHPSATAKHWEEFLSEAKRRLDARK